MTGPERKITSSEPTETTLNAPNTLGLAMITATVNSAPRVETVPQMAAVGMPANRSTSLVAGFLISSGLRKGRKTAETEPASSTRAKNNARLAEMLAMLMIEPPIVKAMATITARMTALIGDWLRSLILARPIGSMRSNASANMTRV